MNEKTTVARASSPCRASSPSKHGQACPERSRGDGRATDSSSPSKHGQDGRATLKTENCSLRGSVAARSKCSGTLTVTSKREKCPASQGAPAVSTEGAPAVSTEHRVIPLTQGKFTIVDAEDYDRLAGHKWYAHKKGEHFYAERRQNGRTISMHRVILDIPPGMQGDHKNHNTLDNRRCNVRICTHAQNQYNKLPQQGKTSRYKGLYWDREKCKWRARIQYHGTSIHIGYYDYEADAAIAYDDKAVELFGEFACLNFNWRPEIRLWMAQTYLFDPTKNDLGSIAAATSHHFVDIPRHFVDIPRHSADIPGHSEDIPGHSEDIPGHSEDIPSHSERSEESGYRKRAALRSF